MKRTPLGYRIAGHAERRKSGAIKISPLPCPACHHDKTWVYKDQKRKCTRCDWREEREHL